MSWLSPQAQLLQTNGLPLESSTQEALELGRQIAQNTENSPEQPGWDWGLCQHEEFCDLKQRADYLEDGSSTAQALRNADSLMRKQKAVLERIADLEGERPGGYAGGVPRSNRGIR